MEEEDENICVIDVNTLARLMAEKQGLAELVASLRDENDRLRYILKGG